MISRKRGIGARNPGSILAWRKAALVFAVLAAFVALGALPCGGGENDARAALMSLQDPTHPVADAGDNITAYVGVDVIFNGSASTDDVAIVNYTWTITDGATATLYGAEIHYVFESAGTYTVALNVTDGDGNWDTAEVTVDVEVDTSPPIVVPGANQSVNIGRNVFFNASRSSDPETGIVNYTWNFTYSGDEVVLYGPAANHLFELSGTYVVTLTVTNGAGLSNSTYLTVTVNPLPTWLSKNWPALLVTVLILAVASLHLGLKWHRNHRLVTDAEKEKLKLKYKDFKKMWALFKGNRLGFAGFVVLCIFMVMAVFAPILSTVKNPSDIDSRESNQLDWDNPVPPTLSPSSYTGFVHPLGTDNIGQDVYSMTLYGTRASLLVGFVATFISIALGVTIGLVSGFFGRAVDEVLMRFTDYFLVLPWFPLMIVLMTIFGQEFSYVIIVIGITSWPSTARIVRSQVLSVKERAFIERARAIGAGDGHIIRRHVFPNVLPLVFANTVLLISLAIFSEAFLDFFGLGDPDVISWGTILEAAYNYGAFDSGAWWWVLPPSFAIILCVLSFSLVGYALDDIFNPKLRKR